MHSIWGNFLCMNLPNKFVDLLRPSLEFFFFIRKTVGGFLKQHLSKSGAQPLKQLPKGGLPVPVTDHSFILLRLFYFTELL